MNEALAVLVQDIGAEVRSRRDPEYIYAAASLGAFAAIVGGVAAVTALANVAAVPFWRHPALIGAAVCVVLATLVVRKIDRESAIYASLRQDQIRLVELLRQDAGLAEENIPAGLKPSAHLPRGHAYSTHLVGGSALASAAFCMAVWYGTITSATAASSCIASPSPASGVAAKP